MEVNFVRYEDKYKDGVVNLINNSFDNYNITDISEDNNVIGLVGLINDKVVGYLNITICTNVIRKNKYSIINYVCVDSDYRGNHIGLNMMEEAIKISKEEGCSLVKLTSREKRIEANKLYQKMGFGLKETNVYEKVI